LRLFAEIEDLEAAMAQGGALLHEHSHRVGTSGSKNVHGRFNFSGGSVLSVESQLAADSAHIRLFSFRVVF
jgi:hypothetical protein